ncbi:MAG: PilN domain-containing protein [bacterium]
MIRINLLPHERKKTSIMTIELIAVGALILVVLVGVGIWSHYLTTVIKEKNATIARKREQVEELRVIINQVNQFEQEVRSLQTRIDTIEMLRNNQTGPVLMMDELQRRLPEEVWLSQMRTTGDLISIRGFGMSQTVIGDLMGSIESSPYFHSVNLKISRLVTQMGRQIYEFEIDFRTTV